MTVHIKTFAWDQPGAPLLGGTALGSLINVLNAVLVTGWGEKPITSITRVGSVATVYVSTGHEKAVGQCVAHAGFDQTEYNGEFYVDTVVDANTYTVQVTGTPTTPATFSGTPTTKVASLGWESPFTGTNKAAYRSADLTSTRHFLYVDDNYDANQAAIMCFEDMTALNVGVGAYPLKGGETSTSWTPFARWMKCYYPTTPTRNKAIWTIFGDKKRFYFLVDWYSEFATGTNGHEIYGFGDFNSFSGAADGYRSFLLCNAINSTTMGTAGYNWPGQLNSRNYYNQPGSYSAGRYVCRGWDDAPGGTRFAFMTLASGSGDSALVSGKDSTTGITWPQQKGMKTVLSPTFILDSAKDDIVAGSTRSFRGILPGVYAVNHSVAFADNFSIYEAAGFSGRKFTFKVAGYAAAKNGGWMFDATGPWE